MRFFVLNTNDLINPESPERAKQLDWLDRALAASKAKWNIVYGHHNIYSAGVYEVNKMMEKDVTPILKKHKVRLLINGHDHNYQRSKPIDGTTYSLPSVELDIKERNINESNGAAKWQKV